MSHLARLLCRCAFSGLGALAHAQAPCTQERVDPQPGAPSGHFGSAVALSDSWLAVGAMGSPRGTVHLYERWTGTFVRRVSGSNVVPFDGFPGGVALDDVDLVAGGGTQSIAYVFDVATGLERAQLVPTAPISGASFGADVALSATHIAVGAPGPTAWPSGIDGTVHVFDRATGQELLEWQPLDLMGGWFLEAGFGTSVALEDGLVIAGAPIDGNVGSVHVYDLAVGARRYRLDAPPGGARFGGRVAAGGGRLAIADYAANVYAGRVSVHDLATGAWLYDVVSPDLAGSDGFAGSVAIDADLLVVGAAYHLHGAGRGAAYVFDAASGAFLYELLGAPAAASRRFGRAVAVRDGVIAVGDPEDSLSHTYAGAAYQCAFPVKVGRSSCGPAAANSTGQAGRLRAHGCAGLAYELTLRADRLPVHQLGAFLASRNPGFLPMHQGSQGTLCLSSPIAIWRQQAASSGAMGKLELALDLTAIPTTPVAAVLPGETWYFQAWYRDANPGPTSNFTGARSVLFH